MGVKGLKCPGCGAPINTEFIKEDGTMFCPYCGNAVKIEDSNTITINKNITKRTINDAKIIKAENEKMEIEKRYEERKDDNRIMLVLLGVMILWVVFLFGKGYAKKLYDNSVVEKMEQEGKISVGDCDDYEGDSYKEVEAQFRSMGFENIELVDLKDSGIRLWKNGKVKSVSISGDTDFDEGDYFSKDEKVVITYH